MKNLQHDQNYAKLKSASDAELEQEYVTMFVAAGETIDETQVDVPEYLKPSEDEISLKNIGRAAIRSHLLQLSNVNLIYRVTNLPLPYLLMSYLLYDATQDPEASVSH